MLPLLLLLLCPAAAQRPVVRPAVPIRAEAVRIAGLIGRTYSLVGQGRGGPTEAQIRRVVGRLAGETAGNPAEDLKFVRRILERASVARAEAELAEAVRRGAVRPSNREKVRIELADLNARISETVRAWEGVLTLKP